jgi:molecular chaperone GrpE
MIQRTLFRASRQAARPVQRTQPTFAPIRQQVGTRAAPAFRWYSDAAAPEAKKEPEAPEVKTENNEVTQLKEQLEKKDKEIIDVKV